MVVRRSSQLAGEQLDADRQVAPPNVTLRLATSSRRVATANSACRRRSVVAADPRRTNRSLPQLVRRQRRKAARPGHEPKEMCDVVLVPDSRSIIDEQTGQCVLDAWCFAVGKVLRALPAPDPRPLLALIHSLGLTSCDGGTTRTKRSGVAIAEDCWQSSCAVGTCIFDSHSATNTLLVDQRLRSVRNAER
jgi:hypothetical protein